MAEPLRPSVIRCRGSLLADPRPTATTASSICARPGSVGSKPPTAGGPCAAGAGHPDRGGAVPDRDRHQRARRPTPRARSRVRRPSRRPVPRSSERYQLGLSQFDVNLPTGILPPNGGPFTETGARTRMGNGAAPKVGAGTPRRSATPSRSRTAWTPRRSGATRASRGMVSETANPGRAGRINTQFAFERVDSDAGGPARLGVAHPADDGARRLRLHDIPLESSCQHNPPSTATSRGCSSTRHHWVRGAVLVPGRYRFLPAVPIRPRVGHAIITRSTKLRLENGALALVMMQQTFSTDNDDAAKFDPNR